MINSVSYKVHRIVAHVFLGECPPDMQVNHKNGIKTDNRISNLEYVTASENTRHSFEVLGKQVNAGEKHGNSKLTSANVIEIRARLKRGAKLKELSIEFGVWEGTISAIKHRRLWKHLEEID